MARPKRHYSDQDRAAALAAYDAEPPTPGRQTRAANVAGVPRESLRAWLRDRENAAPANVRQETTEALSDMFDRVCRTALGMAAGAMQGDAEPARLKDYMVAAAIAVDKAQLLIGQPTARVASMNEDQRIQRAAELISIVEERRKRRGS
jgi:hypothetical protein